MSEPDTTPSPQIHSPPSSPVTRPENTPEEPKTPQKAQRWPEEKLENDGTPRGPKVNSIPGTTQKDQAPYVQLANDEMQPKIFGVPVDKWLSECLEGPDLSPAELDTVGTFANVPFDSPGEKNLYPELVCNPHVVMDDLS